MENMNMHDPQYLAQMHAHYQQQHAMHAMQQQQQQHQQQQQMHGAPDMGVYDDASDGPVKLFVGQVPRNMEEEDLRPVLEVFGPLEDLVIIRDKLTGAHRGCAFASFFARDAAEKAIDELHNKVTLPNSINPLQVRPAEGQAGASQEHKLFIGMIPKTADEPAIRDVFAPFGAIEEVYILRHPTTSISKGCAFLKFKDRQSALDAIQQVNGLVTMERGTSALVVKFADSRRQRLQRARTLAAAAAAYWPLPPQAAAAAAGLPFPQLQQLQQQYMQQMQAFGAQTSMNAAAAAAAAAAGATPGSPSNSFMYYNPYAFAAGNGYGLNTLPSMGFDAPNVGMSAGIPAPPSGAIGSPSSAAVAAAAVLSGVEAAAKASRTTSQLEGPSGANLFIYHLPHDLTDADLATAFAPFGTVISAKVYMDKLTGESKGFGFVSYDAPEAADAAIASMNGFQIGSKRLKVQHKRVHHHHRGGGDYATSHDDLAHAASVEYARMAAMGSTESGAGDSNGESNGDANDAESGNATDALEAAVQQLRIDV